MILAGIDLGKSKAACALYVDGQLSHVEAVELLPGHRAATLATIADWVQKLTMAAEVLYVEEALIGRNPHQSLEIAQTVGAVLSKQPAKSIHQISVSSWKKTVVGKGNATKVEVADWLKAHHPDYALQCGANQDKIDAACIGLYGVEVERFASQLATVRSVHR